MLFLIIWLALGLSGGALLLYASNKLDNSQTLRAHRFPILDYTPFLLNGLAIAWVFLISPLIVASLREDIERGPAQTVGAWCRTGKGLLWGEELGYSECERAAITVISSHNAARKDGGYRETVTYCDSLNLKEDACDEFRQDVLYTGNIEGIDW